MRKNVPLVSIGLPVYNGEKYLRCAIDSILKQSIQDFELIIADNASTDGTQAICKHYAAQDHRIRYYRGHVNRGAAWNYNRVFELSRGVYFKWAAHDDMLAPQFLERCTAILEQHPEVVACFPRTLVIDAQGSPIGVYEYDHYHLMHKSPSRRFKSFLRTKRGPLMCSPVFGVFRRAILAQTRLIGAYDASDFVLIGHTALLGNIYELDEVLFFYRDHPLTSVNAAKDGGYQALTVWFSPDALSKLRVPHLQWVLEFLRAIVSTKMSFWDTLLCILHVHHWAPSKWREFLRDIRWAMKWSIRQSTTAVLR